MAVSVVVKVVSWKVVGGVWFRDCGRRYGSGTVVGGLFQRLVGVWFRDNGRG